MPIEFDYETRDNPLIYDDLLGRINLDASGDANFLRISKLGWIVLELRGGYERLLPNGERKGLKESFERRIGKNIGIRRVCRF